MPSCMPASPGPRARGSKSAGEARTRRHTLRAPTPSPSKSSYTHAYPSARLSPWARGRGPPRARRGEAPAQARARRPTGRAPQRPPAAAPSRPPPWTDGTDESGRPPSRKSERPRAPPVRGATRRSDPGGAARRLRARNAPAPAPGSLSLARRRGAPGRRNGSANRAERRQTAAMGPPVGVRCSPRVAAESQARGEVAGRRQQQSFPRCGGGCAVVF
jgi:hypothetical protein